MTDTNQDRGASPHRSTADPDQQEQCSDTLREPESPACWLDDGHVVANRPAGHIQDRTLLSARVDPFADAQWEVGCEFELGDGRRVPITIDVETATALGQVLIAQAALSWKAGNDEFDAHRVRHAGRNVDTEQTDDVIPF